MKNPTLLLLSVIIALAVILHSCKKEEPPSVTTAPIEQITATSALSGGNIETDGGAAVTVRGVCWSTSQNPIISDGCTSDSSGTGSFLSTITGLTPKTTYYLRAYATNSAGTAYGQEITFETDWGQSGTFTDTRDNIEYEWVRIGNQIWMAENLAYLPSVSPSSEGSETDPYYYVYDYQGNNVNEAKASANYQTYGVLYNWQAAKNDCPVGWHLPADAEWTELENYLITNGYNYDGTTTGNKIAKALASTNVWIFSAISGAVGNTDYPDKRDLTGFSALPGGFRYFNGTFNYNDSCGFWWSATENGTDRAWYRFIYHTNSHVGEYHLMKLYGYSVRCVKD